MLGKQALTEMQASVIYETEALVLPDAPAKWKDLPFYNLVVSGNTYLSPDELLKTLKSIEREMGRDLSAPRWAPRIIDLDILQWGDKVITKDHLQIPHPALKTRPFLSDLMSSMKAEGTHVGDFIRVVSPFPLLVGIVNVTPDSFSDGGAYLDPENAIDQIQKITKQGAAVIEVGAQSTRPEAFQISCKEEWERLKPIFEYLQKEFLPLPAKPFISLDSYYPEVVFKALEYYPLDWINDMRGNIKEYAQTKCKLVLTHNLGVPACRNKVLPNNPLHHVTQWASEYIPSERIILDPGIGFGKTSLQSLALLRDIKKLKELGCEVLVGHSRKSFLNLVTKNPFSNRDIETLAISAQLAKKGVDYLRVHNVEAHQHFFSAARLCSNQIV